MKNCGNIAGIIGTVVAIVALLFQIGILGKEEIIVTAKCDPNFWLEVKTLQSSGSPVAFASVAIRSANTTDSVHVSTDENGIFRNQMLEYVHGANPFWKLEKVEQYGEKLLPLMISASKDGFKTGYTQTHCSEPLR